MALRARRSEGREASRAVRQVGELTRTLEPGLTHLSSEERQGLLKFRPGGEKVWTLVERLAAQHALTLTAVDPQKVDEQLSSAESLRPIADALESLLRGVRDTILSMESSAWSGVTSYYTALQGQARSDVQLRSQLEPARDFFASGHRKPKAAKPPGT